MIKTIKDIALEHGASSVDRAMIWTWAKGFKELNMTLDFILILEEQGYEHRGLYDNGDENNRTYAVRYR